MAIKVFILYRKDKPEEIGKAEQIKAVFVAAGREVNKPVDVELSTNFRQFENISVNLAMTPIVIMNGLSEFAGNVPTLDLVKQRLMNTGGVSEIF